MNERIQQQPIAWSSRASLFKDHGDWKQINITPFLLVTLGLLCYQVLLNGKDCYACFSFPETHSHVQKDKLKFKLSDRFLDLMQMPFSLQKTFFLPRIFLQAGIGWSKCCHCPSSDMASSIGAQGQLRSLSSAFNSFWVLCLLWSDDALIRKCHFTTSQTQSLKKLQFSKLTSMVSWGIWTSICPCGLSFFGVNLGLLSANPFLGFCGVLFSSCACNAIQQAWYLCLLH